MVREEGKRRGQMEMHKRTLSSDETQYTICQHLVCSLAYNKDTHHNATTTMDDGSSRLGRMDLENASSHLHTNPFSSWVALCWWV